MLCTVLKTNPPPGMKSSQPAPHIDPTSSGVPVGEHALRVHPTAPEGDIFAELSLQLGGVHPHRAHLYGVDDVHADLDQVRDRIDRIAPHECMKIGAGAGVDVVTQLFV